MDQKFLMANSGWLKRSRGEKSLPTYVSPMLRSNLLMAAMRTAIEFYSEFFGISVSDPNLGELVARYDRDYSEALALRLFASGGIAEADHLNLWCLGHVYRPEVYVESGVFVGGSLHAFIASRGVSRVFAIDPRLGNLRMPTEGIAGLTLIDDSDFSEIDFPLCGTEALVYFDDHIDTASRILQAHEKGFSYVLADDSTGLEGVCQRMFPPIPTMPMIMNPELLSPGDELTWTFNRVAPTRIGRIINKAIGRSGAVRVQLLVTDELIESCLAARRLITRCERLPNLGEYIPQSHPEPTNDNSKFLVQLHQAC